MNIRSLLIPAVIALALPAFAQAADAKALWTANCAKCHGGDGTGQTGIGKKLKIKDYTSAEFQAAFKDEEIAKEITDGKEKMPAFKEKLKADEVKALVDFIRAFKK